jgi:hypothetical protein
MIMFFLDADNATVGVTHNYIHAVDHIRIGQQNFRQMARLHTVEMAFKFQQTPWPDLPGQIQHVFAGCMPFYVHGADLSDFIKASPVPMVKIQDAFILSVLNHKIYKHPKKGLASWVFNAI